MWTDIYDRIRTCHLILITSHLIWKWFWSTKTFVHLKMTCMLLLISTKLLMENNYSFPVWRPNRTKKYSLLFIVVRIVLMESKTFTITLFAVVVFFFVNNYRVALNNNNHISCMKWQSNCSEIEEKEKRRKQKRAKHCFKQILKIRLAQEEEKKKIVGSERI